MKNIPIWLQRQPTGKHTGQGSCIMLQTFLLHTLYYTLWQYLHPFERWITMKSCRGPAKETFLVLGPLTSTLNSMQAFLRTSKRSSWSFPCSANLQRLCPRNIIGWSSCLQLVFNKQLQRFKVSVLIEWLFIITLQIFRNRPACLNTCFTLWLGKVGEKNLRSAYRSATRLAGTAIPH